MRPPSVPSPGDDVEATEAVGSPAPASAALEALYQERILEHFRHPRGKGSLSAPDVVATARNPLCGEDVTIMASLDRTAEGDRVREVRFMSDGCSITQASASMMTDLVRGRTPDAIDDLAALLRAVVRGDPAAARDETLGPLVALSALARVPARIACAMLPWEALAQGLAAGRRRPAASGQRPAVRSDPNG